MKKVVITLSIVAAVLLGVLVFVWVSKHKLVKDLNLEKEDLTTELVALQNDYATLTSTNQAINDSLAVEREKVGQLIERLQKTEATNRSKIRQYEKELGTLRSIMKGYIVQIDSLNTPVSYTHLDVYKRQIHGFPEKIQSSSLVAIH